MVKVSDALQDTLDQLEALYDSTGDITGVPTGYMELDKLTSGLQPSELLILAARPSQGKTALALNLAENIGADVEADRNRDAIAGELKREELSQDGILSLASGYAGGERPIACSSGA